MPEVLPESAVPGTVVASGVLISPSGDQGPIGQTGPQGIQGIQGIQGPTGPAGISTDAGNIAVAGSDGLILVPQQTIWYQRLRSFNALQNSTFEVDARTAAAGTPTIGAFAQDRWVLGGGGLSASAQQGTVVTGNVVPVPNTNFGITHNYLRVTLATQKTALAATDSLIVYQFVEGPRLRELINDVHSTSILCRGPANFSFGLWLRDSSNTYTLNLLCTLGPVANQWTMITLPNIAIWTPSGTFPLTSGSVGYLWGICLAAGSSRMGTSNGVWLNSAGVWFGAVGQSNFAAQPVNTIFDLAYVGDEPGAICTTPQDLAFSDNLLACERYWQKTYDYATAVGTLVNPGMVSGVAIGTQVQIRGGVQFRQRMAKEPTVTTYPVLTAATANQVTMIGGGNLAAVTTGNVGETSYVVNLSAAPAASASYQWQHVADTGW